MSSVGTSSFRGGGQCYTAVNSHLYPKHKKFKMELVKLKTTTTKTFHGKIWDYLMFSAMHVPN